MAVFVFSGCGDLDYKGQGFSFSDRGMNGDAKNKYSSIKISSDRSGSSNRLRIGLYVASLCLKKSSGDVVCEKELISKDLFYYSPPIERMLSNTSDLGCDHRLYSAMLGKSGHVEFRFSDYDIEGGDVLIVNVIESESCGEWYPFVVEVLKEGDESYVLFCKDNKDVECELP